LPLVVVACVVGGAIGEVGDGIDTWAAVLVSSSWTWVLVSPLESEPQPVGAASNPAAPNIKRRDRPIRIGPAL
jgi:hypothetical protein